MPASPTRTRGSTGLRVTARRYGALELLDLGWHGHLRRGTRRPGPGTGDCRRAALGTSPARRALLGLGAQVSRLLLERAGSLRFQEASRTAVEMPWGQRDWWRAGAVQGVPGVTYSLDTRQPQMKASYQRGGTPC